MPRYDDRSLPPVERFLYKYAVARINLAELELSDTSERSHAFIKAKTAVDTLAGVATDTFGLTSTAHGFAIDAAVILRAMMGAEGGIPGASGGHRREFFDTYADRLIDHFVVTDYEKLSGLR